MPWTTLKSLTFSRCTLLFIALTVLSACGGTKVYDTTKTIVYRDDIFQVTNVQQIKRTTTGILQDKSTVNMANMSRNQVEDLLKQHDTVFVRMTFDLDGQELVYRASDVSNWRDYSRMQGDFDRAQKDIAKLMREKKTAQLKLR
jgi:hypothetical protein